MALGCHATPLGNVSVPPALLELLLILGRPNQAPLAHGAVDFLHNGGRVDCSWGNLIPAQATQVGCHNFMGNFAVIVLRLGRWATGIVA
ncbi:hypothetical protein DSO57_1016132 [Entomophthora muscae]|uniref:Uncharacterized protein n=1 Tax=Entomophthora muscae TaxID=34485 RepID=A0ACC2SIB5_9FUNG|nr:hypothetical protein DSO57_1016132 [Entomophthora muscae]